MRTISDLDAPWKNIPPHPPLLRPSEVVKATGLSKSVVYDNIAKGVFPPFIKVGSRAAAMPKAWLDAVLEASAREALDAHARISVSRDA